MEDTITRFVTDNGYLAMFVLMILDNVGVPFPSEIPLLVGGVLASQGDVNYVLIALVAAAGSLVGALVLYGVARTIGRAIVERWGRLLRITHDDLDHAHAWFERKGAVAVFICRMIPLARTLISVPAGISEMPVGRFGVYTFAGSLPFAFAIIGAGVLLGDNYEKFSGPFSLASVVAASIILMLGAIWLAKRFLSRRAIPPTAGGAQPRA